MKNPETLAIFGKKHRMKKKKTKNTRQKIKRMCINRLDIVNYMLGDINRLDIDNYMLGDI
jgi:hypothetical protein